jgi:hypothetical protein
MHYVGITTQKIVLKTWFSHTMHSSDPKNIKPNLIPEREKIQARPGMCAVYQVLPSSA